MKNGKIIILIITAILLLAGGSIFTYYFYQRSIVTTTITLDINPSIELGLNKYEKIIKAKGLNDDGKEIIDNIKLKNKDIDETINIISDELTKNDYLKDAENMILINIDGDNIKDNAVTLLEEKMNDLDINCTVYESTVTDEDIELAEKYDITPSKASYIKEVTHDTADLSIDNLKELSINDINLAVKEKKEEIKKAEEEKKIEEQRKEN